MSERFADETPRQIAEADVGARDPVEALRRYEVFEEYREERGIGVPASVLRGKPAVEAVVQYE